MATDFGKYRAVVVENRQDPMGMGRLQVDVPALGLQQVWAAACLPPLPVAMLQWPEIGSTVWVEFEAGDQDFPVWTGVAVADPGGVTLPAPGTLTIEAPMRVTVRAGEVALDTPLVNVDGIVRCGTLIAMTTVISPAYTPGAGNIW